MSSRRAGPVPSRMPGQVDDHGHVLVAAPGVAPHMLLDAEHCDPVEPMGIVDEDPASFGENGVVEGVPRDPSRSTTRATVRC